MLEHSSIWQRTAEPAAREALPGDLEAEVAVIGAGLAGVLIADRLKRMGLCTVVLEAARIGSGQTGRTTAKITAQHGMIYDALIRNFGEAKAAQYARANAWAVQAYARMIRERGIDCGFREASAYLYSTVDGAPLRREVEAARRLGLDAEFVVGTELPFPVAGAARLSHQACFHPLKFLEAVSRELEIYESTRVLAVEGGALRTDRGTVRAGKVVFATHFPFINVPGWYFMRMHQERGYVLGLESAWLPEGMYLGADADGLSFRTAEGLLLIGGGAHRTGENSAGGRYDGLCARAKELLNDFREAARWSAQDCVTLDGVPYIGRFSASTPDWYVATGFGKWGMTGAMVAAEVIAGLIAGEPPEWAEVFSPERFHLAASARNLATEAAQSVKGLARGALLPPGAPAEALPIGHGGVVEAQGHKRGVCRDADESRCAVRPRCPHMGCQLEWNPDEQSWDCPCHGSRFDRDGRCIDNPAQSDLD